MNNLPTTGAQAPTPESRTPVTSERLLVSLPEAARRLSLAPWEVFTAVRSGDLPHAQAGDGRRLVHVDDLSAYARQLVTEGATA